MLRKMINSICLTLACMTGAHATSPIGYWKAVDDQTGSPKALVEIWQDEDKQLYGKILKIYNSDKKQELCSACEGDLYNKPIVGMIIMEHLKQQTDQPELWGEGNILDPKNGKTYRCNIQLADNQEKLIVRGYLGMPLFGRTQTWLKVKDVAQA